MKLAALNLYFLKISNESYFSKNLKITKVENWDTFDPVDPAHIFCDKSFNSYI